jgi:hypothetical protein
MTGKYLLGEILRRLVAQLVRANIDLIPYIFENYANRGLAPAVVRVRKLIAELLDLVPSVRVIIDGIDKYPEFDQRNILTELMSLSKLSGSSFKILISSRVSSQINKVLSNKPTIYLRDHHEEVQRDINAYVCERLGYFRHKFSDRLIDTIERSVLERANGIIIPAMH